MYKDKKKDCCTPFNLRAAELKKIYKEVQDDEKKDYHN
jgi:hypothetical protein